MNLLLSLLLGDYLIIHNIYILFAILNHLQLPANQTNGFCNDGSM